MANRSFRRCFAAVSVAAAAAGLAVGLEGYATSGHSWATRDVFYFINPANGDMSESEAIAAIQRGAAPWSDQTRASVRLIYGGHTNGSSVSVNYKNEIFFRNDTSGYIGETYWWYDHTGHLVDFDMIFHDGSTKFFPGPTGCSGGVYLEDLAVHEFGHGLGMEHSTVPGATMNPVMPGYCDMTQMTLDPDDIAGIESLYPPGSSSTPQPPSAPSSLAVAVNSSNPTSSLVLSWKDASKDELGFRVERSTDGVSFGQVAQVGANVRGWTDSGLAAGARYYYRVQAYNSAGSSGYSNVAAGQTQAPAPTSPAPAPTGGTLTVTGKKVRGTPTVTLQWSGFSSSLVDVYRNGSRVETTANDGAHTETLKKGGGSYTYQVCAASTSTCSNTVKVSF